MSGRGRRGEPNGLSSDAELLVRSSGGDSAPFAELYERHVEAVMAFHHRRTGCAQTAADLTAETFAAAFVSRKRFRDTGAPARAWLFTIARRQLNHFVRSEKVRDKYRRRLGISALMLDSSDIDRVEELADFEDARGRLREALASMPPAQAAAVRLRVGDELSYMEVAERLGCSEPAARARVSRGLILLADLMEGA
jgi:RNA polymerase sigma factor (sigma-70 family)